MEPKFVTLPAIKVAGFSIHTSSSGENNFEIPKFWDEYITGGNMEKLHKESFVKSHSEYGACFFEDMQTGKFEYIIGVEVKPDAVIPEGYVVKEIPAAAYAMFATTPSDAKNFSSNIQATWNYMYSEWLPKSGYEYASGCVDFELYDERCMQETGMVCDIYLPISKK